MITQTSTIRPRSILTRNVVWLLSAALLIWFGSTPTEAAERLSSPVPKNRVHTKRTNVRGVQHQAKKNHQTPKRSRSFISRAATGDLPHSMPERPLDGSLVRGKVSQVGFLGACSNGCGPVCDCDEISCGAEAIIEPGCGVDHILSPLHAGCQCGVAGCDGCGEVSCGVEGGIFGEPSCGIGGGGDCSCDSCLADRIHDIPLFLPLLRVRWSRFNFFAGAEGFKGPLNFAGTDPANPAVRSGSGSFGFYQGFNESRSLQPLFGWGLSAQLGVRATQANLSGAQFTEETRQQVFVTGGLFRRVDYGLQYGAVLDYLNDDWYYQADLLQIRGELSWKAANSSVYGFQFTSSLGGDSSSTTLRDSTGALFNGGTISFEPTDQYRFFYRHLLNGNGDWTSFAGWTEEDDGLVGTTLNLPLRQKIVLNVGATFLIPRQGDSSGGQQEEGWNISLGLTFRPGGARGCGPYCRPLFDVADNGTFLVDFQ